MAKRFIVFCIVLLFLCGCAREYVTEANPWGFEDPNTLRMWLNNANAGSEVGRNIGVLTGNPALIGGGILVTGVIGIVGLALFPKKKEGD